MLTIAADPKHLGARIGITAVLHTWGSAMTHHPHVHMIVPGGGISLDGVRWVSTKTNFLLPVLVLSSLFRRVMLEKLAAAHTDGTLAFHGSLSHLADARRFAAFLAPLRKKNWFVYAKEPFAGPEQVLKYLSRYTHRVAISNRRLINSDGRTITFGVKNYRADGPARTTTMTLAVNEFIRRFLLHVLPSGFHRIRHYCLLATGTRAANIERARALLAAVTATHEGDGGTTASDAVAASDDNDSLPPCPCCGSRLQIIERFQRGEAPTHRSSPHQLVFRFDTS